MYLGHQYEEQISQFASRLTLKVGHEIKLHFFDVNNIDRRPDKFDIQAFSYTGQAVEEEDLKSMIADLPCIFWNKRDNCYKEDRLFIICSNPDHVQTWYDIMRESDISNHVCKRYNWFKDRPKHDDGGDYDAEIKEYKAKIQDIFHQTF